MIDRPRRIGWAIATVAFAVAALSSCQAQEDEFWEKVYPCDSQDDRPTCGTDREGEPMVCFAGSELGTGDFCTEACDPEGRGDGASVCHETGALLQRCQPNGTGGGCPEGLRCFATSPLLDEGVCLRHCSDREDCIDPIEPCDAMDGDDACSKPIAGREAVCFETEHLGGHDFCAEACDLDEPSTDANATCLRTPSGSGARLRTCRPTPMDGPSAGCPFGFQCFRTDLLPLPNEGLCLPIPVCQEHSDCDQDSERPFCVGALLRETFPELTAASVDIPTDHLQCTGLLETPKSNCPEGEAGIGMVTIQDVPNICVPGCEMNPDTDRRHPCPPTFTCVAEIEYSPRAPATCVPGLPGYRCKGEHSCLAGDCTDTGLGFDVCTMGCSSDEICAVIDGFRGPFWCVDMPSGKRCLNTESFRHECADETDCLAGEVCSNKDAYHVGRDRTESAGPECRSPCDPDGERCAPRGEMPFSCLPFGECHPGVFGIACRSSDECARGLSCETFDDEDFSARIGSRTFCTARCTTDSDCRRHPFVENELATCLNPALRDSPAEDGVPPGVCIFPE